MIKRITTKSIHNLAESPIHIYWASQQVGLDTGHIVVNTSILSLLFLSWYFLVSQILFSISVHLKAELAGVELTNRLQLTSQGQSRESTRLTILRPSLGSWVQSNTVWVDGRDRGWWWYQFLSSHYGWNNFKLRIVRSMLGTWLHQFLLTCPWAIKIFWFFGLLNVDFLPHFSRVHPLTEASWERVHGGKFFGSQQLWK